MRETDFIRIAALGDTHCTKLNQDQLRPLFVQIAELADVVLLCGDLTDYGLPEEAELLLRVLAPVLRLPVLAVLGNHDFEAAKEKEIRKILQEGGVSVLDGESRDIENIGFVGIKGFGGGFSQRALQPWGEVAIKAFVQEALNESMKLESALAKLRMPQRIVLMHYAPVADTVEGEPPEIYPFLGSSRLEEPLDRYGVTAIFHGHAHSGKPEGRTRNGIPVYNVAMPLLKKYFPDKPPIRILRLPKTAAVSQSVSK